MQIYNRYIITVAILLLLTTVVLVALGVRQLAIYYASYVVEVLAVTELYRHFSPPARRALNVIGITLSGAFFLIIAVQIVQLLRR